ncbi:hypothetical protein ACHAWF_001287, partial [Thalassiosira exigua]
VYGPLLNGVSTLMFESTPTYPDCGRYWDMVQRHRITVFYTAPTAIRSLMQFGNEAPNRYDLLSLKVLGTVGDPINPAAWKWYYDVIGKGRFVVVDTYWQTETGRHVITNLPGITPMKSGPCTLPCYGIEVVILDAATGKEIETSPAEGVLAIKQPWPGMARTCLGDHQSHTPRVLLRRLTAAAATRIGSSRSLAVLMMSSTFPGTESALLRLKVPLWLTLVSPRPPQWVSRTRSRGSCFTTLTEGYAEGDDLIKELRQAMRTSIGPFATPDMTILMSALPMTRSGKIMRQIVRKIAAGELESLGDTTTLLDQSVVDTLSAKVQKLRK